MSGLFDWATSKPFDYFTDYPLPEGHQLLKDAQGRICLESTLWLAWDGGYGVSVGLLRLLTEDFGAENVFVSVRTMYNNVTLSVSALDNCPIHGPDYAYHIVDPNQLPVSLSKS